MGFQNKSTLSKIRVQVPKEMNRKRWNLGFKEDEENEGWGFKEDEGEDEV